MGYSSRIAWEVLRSVNSTALNGTYQALGGPLLNASYILKIVNNSNVLVTISTDGVNDHDVAPANSFWLYDESKTGVNSAFPAMPVGTQIYIKGASGGTNSGLIYLVSQYLIVQ
jgi:hypothetical protein